MIGLYLPGNSPVHRAAAGFKLAMLVVLGVAIVLVRHPWQLVVVWLLVLLGFVMAGLSWRTIGQQLRPVWVLVAVTFVLHVVVTGWLRAVVVVGSVLALILLAALVSLTTRTSELVRVVQRVARPLRRIGMDPERLGLLVALGIRCVPIVVELAREIRDAQRARGVGPELRGFAVAFVVRSLRRADGLADALTARGLDD